MKADGPGRGCSTAAHLQRVSVCDIDGNAIPNDASIRSGNGEGADAGNSIPPISACRKDKEHQTDQFDHLAEDDARFKHINGGGLRF